MKLILKDSIRIVYFHTITIIREVYRMEPQVALYWYIECL